MKPVKTQLKRLLKISSLTVAVVLFPFASLALDVKDVPNPRQINGTWVTDMAEILDRQTEAQLNDLISQLERQNGTEIAVVTVPEMATAALPTEFTTALFKYWGIGKKGKDNGVLFLISKGDGWAGIETGYGVKAILPNAKVVNILSTQIVPRFRQGDFNGGTLAATKALVVALEAPQPSSLDTSSTSQTTLGAQPLALEQEPTQDASVPWGLLAGGGLVVLAIGTAAYAKCRRQVLLKPEGYSRHSGSSHLFLCANCNKQMKKVEDTAIQQTLSQPQKVAQQLGSVRFQGWKCPNCSQQLTGLGFHTVAYESNSSRFCKCPTCQESTATRTKETLQHPTKYSCGRRLVIEECHCCSYWKEWEETIPRLPPPPPSSSSSGGNSFSSGGFSGSGDCGGGSFGGGDSGGSGAGGGW